VLAGLFGVNIGVHDHFYNYLDTNPSNLRKLERYIYIYIYRFKTKSHIYVKIPCTNVPTIATDI